jgi:hypothetical protein
VAELRARQSREAADGAARVQLGGAIAQRLAQQVRACVP